MSSTANIVNGQIANNGVSANDQINKAVEASKKQAGGTLDKDAFLQLLVAQMKYQDPLEPTDNTEYVSQLANFSELEEMQNMVQSSDMQRASSLVGRYVSMAENDATGNTKYTEGFVDSVVYQGNKTYLSIKDVLYNFDNLDKVYDNDYVVALLAAKAQEEAMKNQAANGTGTEKDNSATGTENNANADEDKTEPIQQA